MKRKKEVREKINRKGAIELETLAYWIIAFLVLVIIVFAYLIISGKGTGIIEHIKNLFRFRR